MSRGNQKIWDGRRYRIHYEPHYSTDCTGLVLLSRFYQKHDNTRYTDFKMLKIRNKWMKLQESIFGKDNLTCSICGKQHLSPRVGNNKRNLATLDHVVSIAKDGNKWNDPTNFQIACYGCNQQKDCH